MIDEELMRQALDALVWEAGSEPALYAAQTYAAIAALRERLAQPTKERDAIVKDSDTAYMLLRQSLEALKAVLSDDKPYIKQCKDIKSSIETFLNLSENND